MSKIFSLDSSDFLFIIYYFLFIIFIYYFLFFYIENANQYLIEIFN